MAGSAVFSESHAFAAASTPSPPATPVIGAKGTQLTLNGQPYRFIGVNAYSLATDWGINSGCGDMFTDQQLNAFFAALRPNSLVRFWAFQGTMTTNITTHKLDWDPLDRVFAAAAAHHQRLIVTLTDQGGVCDSGHWQDPDWYFGGFMRPYNSPDNSDGQGLAPLSYWNYMEQIVNRYKSSPALGMWEPISEAEASSCPQADEPNNCSGNQTCVDGTLAEHALLHFFNTVGEEIHRIDPAHLVEEGLMGAGQCGTSYLGYSAIAESPGIDVLSYHDYSAATVPLPQGPWDGLNVRFAQAQQVGKPIIGGEVGIIGGDASGCLSLSERTTDFEAKATAQFAAGSSGLLLWNYLPAEPSGGECGWDTYPGDPLLTAIANYNLGT